MNKNVDWQKVKDILNNRAHDPKAAGLRPTQRDSLLYIAERLPQQPGVLIADEVGLGKTRIACAVMDAVMDAGGSVAVVVPAGLLYQWDKEFAAYCGEAAERTAIHLRSYGSLFASGSGYPVTKSGQWALISHRFTYPRIYKNTSEQNTWKFRLPTLIRHYWEKDDANYRRTVAGRFLTEWEFLEKDGDILEKWENNTLEYEADLFSIRELQAARYLSGEISKSSDWADKIRGLPSPRKQEAHLAFTNDETAPGRIVMEELMKRLIGPLDLVVIDEAHKSREADGQKPRKQLGQVLERLTKQKSGVRWLGLTATPVELGAEQWKQTLARIRLQDDDSKCVMMAVDKFDDALRQANGAPDELPKLNCLVKASQDFAEALRPWVTRRLVRDEPDMQTVLQRIGEENAIDAHPHRRFVTTPIRPCELTPNWLQAIMALEGQGQAAKGSRNADNASRRADTNYASGLHRFDIDDTDVEEKPPTKDDLANAEYAKEHRKKFWQGYAASLVRPNTGQELEVDPLFQHPRVRKAVERIEYWTQLRTNAGSPPEEKVLVFGTYSKPMKTLRDVLNARHLLRAIDRGVPILPPKELLAPSKESLDPPKDLSDACLLHEYGLMFGDGADKSVFQGQLAGGWLSKKELRRRFKAARSEFEKLRARLRDQINTEFLSRLPGDAMIGRMSKDQQDRIAEHLRNDLINHLILKETQVDQLQTEEMEQLAQTIWRDALLSVLNPETPDEEDGTNHTEWDDQEDTETVELDRRADRLDVDRFLALLDIEPNEVRSRFCRLMEGGTRQQSRRLIQAAFNRTHAYPRVLIAQSLVGREGLNLQEACRVMLLFHLEWNPAVLEQQIGRIDRINSRWWKLAESWLKDSNATPEDPPRIEVEAIVFEGTYDAYQFSRLQARQQSLNAQLFGAMLSDKAAESVPANECQMLVDAAPNFSPPKVISDDQ